MGAMRPQIIATRKPILTPPAVFYTIAQPKAVTLDVVAQGEVRPSTDITLTAKSQGASSRPRRPLSSAAPSTTATSSSRSKTPIIGPRVAGAKARVAQAEELLRREEAESDLARKDYEDLGRKRRTQAS